MLADPASVLADASAFLPWIGPSIQAGAIVVSAIGVAWMIRTNRTIARQRAVLDLIVKEQTDADMIKARKTFVNLKQKGDIVQYASLDKIGSEEASHIRFILNMYEVVAIGINKNAYDERIYKDWCRTTAVRDWMACKDFIHIYQRDVSPKIYAEFEKLAKRWANHDESKHI